MKLGKRIGLVVGTALLGLLFFWTLQGPKESLPSAPQPIAEAAPPPAVAKPSVRPSAAQPTPEQRPAVTPSASHALWSRGITSGQRIDLNADHPLEQPGLVTLYEQEPFTLTSLKVGQSIQLPLVDGMRQDGTVNLVQTEGTIARVAGQLARGGTFRLGQEGDRMQGVVLPANSPFAYVIETREDQIVSVREVPNDAVICDAIPRPSFEAITSERAAVTMAAPPLLSSRSDATAVLYLDFDGESVTDPSWNGGVTINLQASTLSSYEINSVWERVKEDFWPFNIDVTTNPARYESAPVGKRMRIIITPSSSWYSSTAGGVAQVNSFSEAGSLVASSTIPAFVFNSSVVGVAEAISHEAGHTFGLHHDGRTTPAEEYYTGHYGAVNWGPIMGASYYMTLVQWSKGDYANANQKEDDLAIIGSTQNGFGLVADDVGNETSNAKALTITDRAASATGTISSDQDSDVYSLTLPACTLSVTATLGDYSPNLDVSLSLLNASGDLIATYAEDYSLNAGLNKALAAGTYYVKVRGAGYGDGLSFGYPAYGSIGAYKLNVTVNDPPQPPKIISQPSSQTVVAGENVYFSIQYTGAWPISFQWQKDGVDIPGATYDSFYKQITALSEAGDYRVKLTNEIGTATSDVATLTVTTPPPPTVSGTLYDRELIEGDYLHISVFFYGSALTYQWYHDGVAMPGETSYSLYISSVTAKDAGEYYVVATNPGGSAQSNTATVTVAPTPPPTFSYINVNYRALESGELLYIYIDYWSRGVTTVEWLKDGVPITTNSSSVLRIDSVSVSDGGIYTVKITNKAGSTTSPPISISVNPPGVPLLSTLTMRGQQSVSYGSPISLTAGVRGGANATYQWYRNGMAIPGATGETYTDPEMGTGDFGDYWVTVTNEYGSTTSARTTFEPASYNSPGYLWTKAQQKGDVVHFLFRNPARIARYNLKTQTWLAESTSTLGLATAFAVGDNELFVAYGKNIYRYAVDPTSNQPLLSGGTLLATRPSEVSNMWMYGNVLVTTEAANTSDYWSIATLHRTTGAIQDSKTEYFSNPDFAFDLGSGQLVVRYSYNQIGLRTIATNGTIGDADYFSSAEYDIPSVFKITGTDLVLMSSGLVYSSSSGVSQRYLGGRVRDVSQNNGSVYLAKRSAITRCSSNLHPQAEVPLAFVPHKVATTDTHVFAFGQTSRLGDKPTVKVLPQTDFQDYVARTVPGPNDRAFRLGRIEQGDGVIYISELGQPYVHRWSIARKAYLPSLEFSTFVTDVRYSSDMKTLYVTEEGTTTRAYNTTASSWVSSFVAESARYTQIATPIGDHLLIKLDGRSEYYFIGEEGSVAGRTYLYSADDSEFRWSANAGKIYCSYDTQVVSQISESDFAFGWSTASPRLKSKPETICVSPSGAVVIAGSGDILDAGNLSWLGNLGREFTGGTWTADAFFTLSKVSANSEVQRWNGVFYEEGLKASVPGSALKLFSLPSGDLLAITSKNGVLNFTRLRSGDLVTVAALAPGRSDFDGDNRSEILLQDRTTGALSLLKMGTSDVEETSLTQVPPAWKVAATADFNHDDKVDILWENPSTGEHAVWLMDGTTLLSAPNLPTIDPDWRVAAVGDLNGDGSPDLVWQLFGSGETSVWFMDETSFQGSAQLPPASAEWSLLTIADLNGDQKGDLLWRNTQTGELVAWHMNGLAIASSKEYGAIPQDWQLVQASDFDGDGSVDILWLNSATREVVVWLLNAGNYQGSRVLPKIPTSKTLGTTWTGRSFADDFDRDGKTDLVVSRTDTGARSLWLPKEGGRASTALGTIANDWTMVATGDINGDGMTDLLWQNTQTGEGSAWLMKRAQQSGSLALPTVDKNWRIVASADFNRDGHLDLAWRNLASGEICLWYLQRGAYVSSQSLGSVSNDWVIVGAGDFSSDGMPDLLWRNKNSGDLGLWELNSGAFKAFQYLGNVPTAWKVVQVTDMNTDGSPDIVWHHATSKDVVVWLMNGPAYREGYALGTTLSTEKVGTAAAQ